MILFTASPVNTSPAVQYAVKQEYSHRSGTFQHYLDLTKHRLCQLAGKPGAKCAILPGCGSLAVAAAIQTFVGYDAHWTCATEGKYSDRMCQFLSDEEYYPDGAPDWVLVCHNETEQGRMANLSQIIDHAHDHGAKVLVDAVSSFGSHEVDPRADVICTCGNKCLESLCGSSIVIYNEELHQQAGSWNPLDVCSYADTIPSTLNVPSIMGLRHAIEKLNIPVRQKLYEARANQIRNGIKLPMKFTENLCNNVTTFKCDKETYNRIEARARMARMQVYKYVDDYFMICNMGYGLDEHIPRLIEVVNDCIR